MLSVQVQDDFLSLPCLSLHKIFCFLILCCKCCSHSLIVRFALGLVHPLDVGVANIEDKVRDPSLLLFLSPRLHFKMVDFIGHFPKGP